MSPINYNLSCYICNNSLFGCSCEPIEFENSTNNYRCYSCHDTSYCISDDCNKQRLKIKEAKIQNQVSVSQNHMLSVVTAFNIRGNKENASFNRVGNITWGNSNNLRNQSDRALPHFSKNNNVPTRGNSLKTSITSNRPGSMKPGGTGVDVKHGSYARYLGKIKANNISVQSDGKSNIPVNSKNINNNKLYRFTIINTNDCC
jgi:hypothetical protein